MADENKNPEEEVETVHVDASPDDEAATTPDYEPEGEAEQLEPKTSLEAGVKSAMEAAEKAEDHPTVSAVDSAIESTMETAEEVVEGGETLVGEHHYSDTFTVPFYGEMTLPGGIYTFVFGVLAVLTVLEVFTAEVLPDGGVKIAALLGAAVAKALLVMAFYMHLSRDNWLFRFVLGVPFFITLASVLYLLGVSPTGY